MATAANAIGAICGIIVDCCWLFVGAVDDEIVDEDTAAENMAETLRGCAGASDIGCCMGFLLGVEHTIVLLTLFNVDDVLFVAVLITVVGAVDDVELRSDLLARIAVGFTGCKQKYN